MEPFQVVISSLIRLKEALKGSICPLSYTLILNYGPRVWETFTCTIISIFYDNNI